MQTKFNLKKMVIAIVACLSFTQMACQKENKIAKPEAEVLTATGDSLSIVSTLEQFRNLLGSTLNTEPGKTGGRREINWDGVPPGSTNVNTFPGDFFAQTDAALPNGRKRGAVLTSTFANDFRVSSFAFDDIYSGFATQFKVFSRKLVFGTMNGNVLDVTFKVPGQSTDATVKGFGVIFLDVDVANKTSLEFFDVDGNSLGKYFAKASDKNFSFIGVKFKDNTIVNKVRITAGEEGISKTSSYKDKVGMDDFLYDEPVAK